MGDPGDPAVRPGSRCSFAGGAQSGVPAAPRTVARRARRGLVVGARARLRARHFASQPLVSLAFGAALRTQREHGAERGSVVTVHVGDDVERLVVVRPYLDAFELQCAGGTRVVDDVDRLR